MHRRGALAMPGTLNGVSLAVVARQVRWRRLDLHCFIPVDSVSAMLGRFCSFDSAPRRSRLYHDGRGVGRPKMLLSESERNRPQASAWSRVKVKRRCRPSPFTYRPHLGLTSRADSPTTPGRIQRLFVGTLPLRSSGRTNAPAPVTNCDPRPRRNDRRLGDLLSLKLLVSRST